jgi:hypothetical protein
MLHLRGVASVTFILIMPCSKKQNCASDSGRMGPKPRGEDEVSEEKQGHEVL